MSGISDALRYVQRTVDRSKGSPRKARLRGTVAPVRPQLHSDPYMTRVDIEDHIVPLWDHLGEREGDSERREVTDVDLEYSYSLEQFIQRSSIASDYTESSYDDDFSRFSESEVEDSDVRGVYLDGVQSERVQPGVLDPEAHPVYIEGVPIHGGTVECLDMSPYRDQFGVLGYEWFIGIDFNCADRYDPVRIGRDRRLFVPLDAVGKYIFCRAHRRVEHQAVEEFNLPKVGVYDPHVSGSHNAGYLPHDHFYDISSWCVAGPVYMCDEWSLQIMKSLSEGVHTMDALLYYADDLVRGSTTANDEDFGHVTVHIDYEGVALRDHGSLDAHVCSVQNMRKIYNSRVFGGEDTTANLEFSDFEVEESGEWLFLSIHKCEPLVCYVSLKFSDDSQRVLAFFMISSFRFQKALGHDTKYWHSQLIRTDVSSIRDMFRESSFL
ncbi:uncharacterized protein BXIN_0526 [Babesia sp. Xinjiang]|uniref:uncharacterized protein n=1 Tax=Babesia sp. Xinjiang TaxID=462227 RepID=UPI000A2305C3|nr:uncharacterized protein BXIN_0526 [Babesia sp. Xinjiang]ORM41897.1 hypothetical protein BXIN_0526 [Babesia sp. Xinjiang]